MSFKFRLSHPSTYLDIFKQHQVKIPRLSWGYDDPNTQQQPSRTLKIKHACLIQQLQKHYRPSTLRYDCYAQAQACWKRLLFVIPLTAGKRCSTSQLPRFGTPFTGSYGGRDKTQQTTFKYVFHKKVVTRERI